MDRGLLGDCGRWVVLCVVPTFAALVDDQHDSQHDQEDCEERAERNEYAFTEGAPASWLLSSIFGADV